MDPTQRQYVRVVHPDDEPSLVLRYGISWADIFAVAFGVVVTFVVGGYQFGKSNHTVYLLDAVHTMNPKQLTNDWFTTQTFQYHALFGLLTTAVWRFLLPAYFLMYLGLAVLLHVAWFRLTRLLGGGRFAYMISVGLLYLSGGGTALGGYGFLQDSAFLPSNISSVALLWGILFWMLNRPLAAGLAMAVAAAFHLNYAVIVPVVWLVMVISDQWDYRSGRIEPAVRPWFFTQWVSSEHVWAAVLALGASAGSIALALRAMPVGITPMPFDEFLDLYVRLRHPHHYNPRGWPVAMWVAFGWAIVPALWMTWKVRRALVAASPVRQAYRRWFRLTVLFLLVLAAAWVVAGGYMFLNERVVQLSLFRFSVFPQLLMIVAAAVWLAELKPLRGLTRPLVAVALPGAVAFILYRFVDDDRFRTTDPFLAQANAAPLRALAVLLCLPLLVLLVDKIFTHRQTLYAAATLALLSTVALYGSPQRFGMFLPREDESIGELARWASNPKNSPMASVFLMPPDEESFRLLARRAIVVNFKGVPQLSSEMPHWRDRMEAVLDMPDLRKLPQGVMPQTLAAIARRYDDLPAEHLASVAAKYDARFVVTRLPMRDAGQHGLAVVFSTVDLGYFVYERVRHDAATVPATTSATLPVTMPSSAPVQPGAF